MVLDPPTSRLDEALAKALGARSAGALAKLGLHTVGDLLYYFPRRHEEPGTLTVLARLPLGEHVTVMAQVIQATTRTMRSRQGFILSVVVGDGSQELSLTFFAKRSGMLHSHQNRLKPGRVGLFTGTVSAYRGTLQLTHPDYLILGADVDSEEEAIAEASRPIPIYRSTQGAPSWRIARCVQTVLGSLRRADLPDPLPQDVRSEKRVAGQGLPDLFDALHSFHQPQTMAEVGPARLRFRFEEAFVLQTALARRRSELAGTHAVARPPRPDGLAHALDARLPFELTAGQRAVAQQISADLAQSHPMHRLLQGEVGSGKTVVALRAMAQVIDAGGQAALLAPTEVLAAQHYRSLRGLLGDLAQERLLGDLDGEGLLSGNLSTSIVLLTGSQGAQQRRRALEDIEKGAAGIVVGTHALLSDPVQFADLGLVVVDEQHRFGVEQRDALRAKAADPPHLLVMTATPIPRTVAMTVFGDLDTSTLSEIPAGRAGVSTHVVPADNQRWMDRTWQRLAEEVRAGHRGYVVCPRINDDQMDDEVAPDDGAPRPLAALDTVAAELAERSELAGLAIGVLHGRLPAEDKERAMADFTSGRTPILVATTVIEVGVDVPDATVMVVLDADRFGISQLHQLRGRIGRGSAPGVCLLVSHAAPQSIAAERLNLLAEHADGFTLAAKDLSLRREGDVLGAAQSGRSSLRLLRVVADADLIALARELATTLIESDPDLGAHPVLAAQLDRDLAEREDYLERS